jgi:hypothetical protein
MSLNSSYFNIIFIISRLIIQKINWQVNYIINFTILEIKFYLLVFYFYLYYLKSSLFLTILSTLKK